LKEKINKIIALLQKEFKATKPKPPKSDPLDMLIATMLSQNTTDKTSYRAFQNLKTDYKNWEDVMSSPQAKIKKSIKVCGLSNQKSRSIQKLLRQIKKKHNALNIDFIKKMKDEDIYNELIQYDGVGVKTISCVLAFSLGRDVFPVDTHVHRVTNRLGLVNTKTPDKTFEAMQNIVPKGKKYLFHNFLIFFGRKICRAKNPLCNKCVLYDMCEFKDKEFYSSLGRESQKIPKENNFIVLENV
jgi:endonuclease-3